MLIIIIQYIIRLQKTRNIYSCTGSLIVSDHLFRPAKIAVSKSHDKYSLSNQINMFQSIDSNNDITTHVGGGAKVLFSSSRQVIRRINTIFDRYHCIAYRYHHSSHFSFAHSRSSRHHHRLRPNALLVFIYLYVYTLDNNQYVDHLFVRRGGGEKKLNLWKTKHTCYINRIHDIRSPL